MEKEKEKSVVIVVGGGPAGLMAASTAAACGARAILFEKNSHCGKKLLLTGSGKCNITNQAPLDLFLEQYAENRKFLYPAFKSLFHDELEHFFNRHHVFFVTEENGKVFPSTKTSGTVLSALLEGCAENKVEIHLEEPVISIEPIQPSTTEAGHGRLNSDKLVDDGQNHSSSVDSRNWKVITAKCTYEAQSVILATGGLSYPKTGSTGNGYQLAKACSHTIVSTRPALVPVEVVDPWCTALSGISMRGVAVGLYEESHDHISRKIAEQRGDLLFTHFGLSGPPVLFLSRWLPDHFEEQFSLRTFIMTVDLLPMRSTDEIEKSLLQAFAAAPARQLKTILSKDYGIPLAAASALVSHLGFKEEITGQEITREKRKCLLSALKSLRFPLSKTRGYQEAMVTAGGISTKEIRPQTMESKLVSNLFFAGELIDIDGFTGGYNLQAAFSTGYLAGRNASQ